MKYFKLRKIRKEREKTIVDRETKVIERSVKKSISNFIPIFFKELKDRRNKLEPIYFEKLLLLTRSIPIFFSVVIESEQEFVMEILEDVKNTIDQQSLKELDRALLVIKDIEKREVVIYEN